ncbi:hypothetical protein LEP1GSC150_1378 [Leptospira interrogans serovar Copenhageni str. LT2050]|uniref:Uncharacterized protein n=1 Tax=Leptospira interrogans serovar Copenhageni str. LT2050 TaxID=1001598 RepID=M3IM94_LEPIT|nr:hypothetical protein LEP1GSC150_1378 [Leptospira interrogans serovar Copenhageni str. LT2050]
MRMDFIFSLFSFSWLEELLLMRAFFFQLKLGQKKIFF